MTPKRLPKPHPVTRLRDHKLAEKLREIVRDIEALTRDDLVNHERADPGERRAWRAVAASLRNLIDEIVIPKPRRGRRR